MACAAPAGLIRRSAPVDWGCPKWAAGSPGAGRQAVVRCSQRQASPQPSHRRGPEL